MSMRMEKINKEIMRQLTDIIHKEIDDPLADFLSITKVDTTSDLQESKVYFSLLDEKKYPDAEVILNKMSKFIRLNLGKRIRIKTLPELRFIPDDSIKYSVEIYQRIEEIQKEEK